MAYDAQRGVVVMFGGRDYWSSLGDTWEWDGTTWSLRSQTGPSPRTSHAMAYDAARGVTVLHGGNSGSSSTWEWNGTTWQLRSTNGPSRAGHAMMYDDVRKSIILFGGTSSSQPTHQTWEWHGEGNGSWTIAAENGPSERSEHGMAYDSARGKGVLFGALSSSSFDETWEWDSQTSTWELNARVSAPPGRREPVLVFDSTIEQVVMFGGMHQANFFGDLWTYGGDQPQWQLQESAPTGADGSAMCFDTWRKRIVLVEPDPWGEKCNTWEWDVSRWLLKSNEGPPRRAAHAVAFDQERGVTVLFGGQGWPVSFNDTWEWNGVSWRLVSDGSKTNPAPRWDHAMVFDSQRNVVVLFGGTDSNTTGMGDTWEWDGTSWIERTVSGPPPRRVHAMAYDAVRGETVLFGGMHFGPPTISYSDTWTWNGTTWKLKLVAGPGVQAYHAMTYHSSWGKVMLYGSSTFEGQWWEWDGSNWTTRHAPGPGPKNQHCLAFDPVHVSVVLFGGGTAETWKLGLTANCPADINSDGVVSVDDLLIILNTWGTCTVEPCIGDIDGDGLVGASDLLQLLASW